MKQEENKLMEEILKVEAALKEEEAKNKDLKQQTDVRLPPSTRRRRLQSSVTCPVNLYLLISGVLRCTREECRLHQVDWKGSRQPNIRDETTCRIPDGGGDGPDHV